MAWRGGVGGGGEGGGLSLLCLDEDSWAPPSEPRIQPTKEKYVSWGARGGGGWGVLFFGFGHGGFWFLRGSSDLWKVDLIAATLLVPHAAS